MCVCVYVCLCVCVYVLIRIEDQPRFTTELTSFRVMSQDEIRKIIMKSSSKSCDLDPIPTWLLKVCLNDLLVVITDIVNTSFESSAIPEDFKLALLLPILKKYGLELVFPNYRPISNLHFVSKVLERSACLQLVDHLNCNGLYEKFQSAYMEGRSCETALLHI